jgi:hypothetical protein
MTKPLRGWRRDLAGLWGRLSLFQRLLVGGAVALIGTWAFTRWVSRPLATEVAALAKKAPKSEVRPPDRDQQVLDARHRLANAAAELASWQKRVEAARDSRASLDADVAVAMIPEFDALITRARVAIKERIDLARRSEDSAAPAKPERKAVRAGGRRPIRRAPSKSREREGDGAEKKPKARIKEDLPSFIATSRYQYVVEGGFNNVHALLLELARVPYLCKFENLELTAPEPDDEGVPSPRQPLPLRLKFDVVIYHAKSERGT